jgi:hypothetical protein
VGQRNQPQRESDTVGATNFKKSQHRVDQKPHDFVAPSEPCERFSPYTAQAAQEMKIWGRHRLIVPSPSSLLRGGDPRRLRLDFSRLVQRWLAHFIPKPPGRSLHPFRLGIALSDPLWFPVAFQLSAFAFSTIFCSLGNCIFLTVHLVRAYSPDTLSSLPVSALNGWFAVFVTDYRRRLRAFLYPGDWDSTRQLLHFGFPCLTLPSHLLFGSCRLRGLRKFNFLPISSYTLPAFRLELPLGLGFASPACHPASRNRRRNREVASTHCLGVVLSCNTPFKATSCRP